MSTILILFDVDGTLTKPMEEIEQDMITVLEKISKINNIDIGFVGGSDYNKQLKQIGKDNIKLFKWKFTENGLVSYYNDELINNMSIVEHLGEQKYQNLINTCMKALSNTNIPKKRGNFIELRKGMINISPIGRNCSQSEREEFYHFDKINNTRQKIIHEIKHELPHLNLQYSIGGQISIDIFPYGWNKTYCLKFVENKYDKIYFFGDKTDPGGNDYEIYNDARIIGFNVKDYHQTIDYLTSLFLKIDFIND